MEILGCHGIYIYIYYTISFDARFPPQYHRIPPPPVSMDIFGSQPHGSVFFVAMENQSKAKPREGLKVFGKLSLGGRNCLEDGNEYQDDITTVIISWRPENPGTKLLHLSHDCMLGMGGTCAKLWAEQKSLDGRRKT